jgi:ABC-type Zn uptake system ZnuABC Zn-binding protein ZnuA
MTDHALRNRWIARAAAVMLACAGVMSPVASSAQLRVVTTTEDLASIAREVGGDHVQVFAIARGYQDPHFVDPKPSFILEMNRADLLVVVGRELELGWLPPLITSSRNADIQPGASGYLDASQNVNILEIPTGQITRAMGDVHPQGNPHYWLDPANGRIIAQSIRGKLTALLPDKAADFDRRYQDFDRRLAAGEARWDAAMAPYKGTKIVTYHRSWPNFMERFGLDVIGYVEPKPGIPPSPSHTIALIGEMRRQGVKLIVVEPYFDKRTPRSIANQVGGMVLELAPSAGGLEGVTDYIALFDRNIELLTGALATTTGR